MHDNIKVGVDNPFNPGPGTLPLYFAGREFEEEYIHDSLNVLVAETNEKNKLMRVGANAPYMLIGPRGVGKTVMLARTREKARELGIDCYTLKSSDFSNNFGRLVEILSSKNQPLIEKVLSRVKITYKEAIDFKYVPNLGNRILELLIEANLSKGNSILFICDEAHEYDLTEFGNFVNSLQEFMSEKYPISTIFAGTTKLARVRSEIKASFIGRYNVMRINLLSIKATKKVLTEPFKEFNIKFASGVLNKLVTATDNYPYFVQIIGQELWSIVYKNNIKTITEKTVKQAIKNSMRLRREYYIERQDDIKFSSNRKVIYLEIIKFIRKNKDAIDLDTLQEYLGKKYTERVYNGAIIKLLDKGIIYENEDDFIVPGIPSFFDYILKKKKK